MKTGPMKGKRRWSEFAQWVRDNPDEVLPPSVKEIHEMTGISKDSIKSYLYRRRKEAKSLIASQPWLNRGSALATDSLGVRIPVIAWKQVRSFIGLTGSMKFVVRLRDGTPHIFYMTLNKFKEIFGA